jgi:hypothetical protein
MRGKLNDTALAGATIGRAQSLNGGSLTLGYADKLTLDTTRSIPLFWGQSKPDFGLASAVYNGFSTSNVVKQSVKTDCLSGNCTWPIFTSAAVCSKCSDVSSHIIPKSGRVDRPDNSAAQEGTDKIIAPWIVIQPHNFTSYDLPYSHIKSYDGFLHSPIESNLEDRFDFQSIRTLMTLNSITDPSQTINFQSMQTLLIAFLIMGGNPSFLNNTTRWEASTPSATECALYLCANTYKSVLIKGNLEEKLLDTSTEVEPESWQPVIDPETAEATGMPDLARIQRIMNWTTLHMGATGPNRTDLQLVVFKNESIGVEDARFNVSQRFVQSATDFIFNISGKTDGVFAYPAESGGARFIDQFFTFRNDTAMMEKVALSITNYIRDSLSVPQHGTIQQWTVFVHIRWEFLILPGITMLFGCLYVLFTIVETLRLGLPGWKADSLPILSHGLDAEAQSFVRTMEGSTVKVDFDKKIMVRLEDGEDGLRLRQFSGDKARSNLALSASV